MDQPGSAADDEAVLDVFMQGTTFFDMVLTGLPSQPVPGTEIHAEGMGSCPGGIANLAIAASRLGLRTGLASTFGDDVYGDFLWRTLEQEGVDLARSQRVADWHSPVTDLAGHATGSGDGDPCPRFADRHCRSGGGSAARPRSVS